jgi:xanthine dehydrogenase accessory factor
MRDFIASLVDALDRGQDCVYCCVVETRGSTPQKAGAAMLVFADGSQRGTLGGGCVEAEVKRRALQVLAEHGPPELRTFTLDDDYGWDDGLICGGRMTMLIDALSAKTNSLHADYYRSFLQLLDAGRGCTEAIVHEAEARAAIGSRYLFDPAGNVTRFLGDALPPAVLEHLPALHRRPSPFHRGGVAYLPVLPRITLWIVGAGHVGEAVARRASEVDFDVWVLDDRESYASRERFPTAKRLIVGEIGSTLRDMVREVGQSTYCIIVTRGHAHDEEALYHLAPTQAGYVGMIGSKRKIRMIYEDLVAKGIPPVVLGQVHAPLGLDIGSQTVPEIAISIVAELIAWRNVGPGGVSCRTPIRPGNARS